MINFKIFRNRYKEKATEPDYVIKGKLGDSNDLVKIGVCWERDLENSDSTEAEKFLSCALETPYKDRLGFEIVSKKTNE